MQYDYDLFVIGAGSGGVRAARISAQYGARVAICEDRYMGGTCVNVGCVPKKLYVYASEFSKQVSHAKGFGWATQPPEFDWQTLVDAKKAEISRLNSIYDSLLGNTGVEIIQGRGKITDAHTVTIGEKTVTAERILIAVGGWPFVPDIPGKEHAVTSNEIFDLPKFPKRLAIVGGGYIATEFACIFNGLGAEVTQLYRGDLFLKGFDNEVREFIAQEIPKQGVNLQFNSDVEKIDKQADGSLVLQLKDGSQLEADAVLYATGRKPYLSGLLADNVTLEMTKSGYIAVNEKFQTSIPSVLAVGDVTGGMELTPVALEEGMTLARHYYDGQSCELDYTNIATAVFCQPNIGTVGMTEEQARIKYPSLKKYHASFRALKHTITGSSERTMMKMLVDGESDKVVGVHMVGPEAGEIMQGIAIALKAGATKAVFDATIGIHPTLAEEFTTMRTAVGENSAVK